MAELEVIRHRYRQFAETECRGYSDLYYQLALGVAGEDSIVRFIASKPVIQPNLFFAALQFLVGPDRMPTDIRGLRALLSDRGVEIADVMHTHRTQTNEVGRCAVIVPALPSGPVALLEVGASAGLCLLLDKFFYDYGSTSFGSVSSPVRVACAIRGTKVPPPVQSHIVWRRGLDVQPIDIRDPHAIQWLLACVWADHPVRRQRLMAAIELAQEAPPNVVRGDLVDDLHAAVSDAPEDARLVVLHSAVLPYVQPERRAAFERVLADVSRRREVIWLSNEAAGVVSRLTAGVESDASLGHAAPMVRFVVGRTILRDGVGADAVLAVAHPHGNEMTWVGETG